MPDRRKKITTRICIHVEISVKVVLNGISSNKTCTKSLMRATKHSNDFSLIIATALLKTYELGCSGGLTRKKSHFNLNQLFLTKGELCNHFFVPVSVSVLIFFFTDY